jgi:hypothetical protein
MSPPVLIFLVHRSLLLGEGGRRDLQHIPKKRPAAVLAHANLPRFSNHIQGYWEKAAACVPVSKTRKHTQQLHIWRDRLFVMARSLIETG